jgi:hypothetical protein
MTVDVSAAPAEYWSWGLVNWLATGRREWLGEAPRA